jgi:hypothetical protein
MQKDWLKRRLTIEQAEAEQMVTDARLGREPVPFGFCNCQWRDLIAKMQPGDELWEFSHIEGPLCGEGGFAIIRHGELVGSMTTWRS